MGVGLVPSILCGLWKCNGESGPGFDTPGETTTHSCETSTNHYKKTVHHKETNHHQKTHYYNKAYYCSQ